MTVPADQPVAFHVAFVVYDINAVEEHYRALLGVERWHIWERPIPMTPWNSETSDAVIKVAYGRAPGLTIELVQVLQGETVQSVYLRDHGEGIQHIGFWAPDVRSTVARAMAEGAKVTSAMLVSDDVAAFQLSASASDEQIRRAVDPNGRAYVNLGASSAQIEYIGPASGEAIREMIGADFGNVVPSAPWMV